MTSLLYNCVMLFKYYSVVTLGKGFDANQQN